MYYSIPTTLQRFIYTSTRRMSGYPAELLNDQSKHHWSIKLFDRENGLADRNAHFGSHKTRLAEFKKQNPGAIGK